MTVPRTELQWRMLPAVDQGAAKRLASTVRVDRRLISPLTAQLLVRRGFSNPGFAARFLDPDDATIERSPASAMKGMKAAANRVIQAVERGEKIVIFGDYDADGIPGTALLTLFLRNNGGNVTPVIPPREKGYGLSMSAARDILARHAPKLVITIDCGSSDHESIRYLRSNGVEVVVTDHHLTLKGVPPTPYFVNPSRHDGETYPDRNRGLCGCGVAYKMVEAMSTKGYEPALHDLVAVSTVGDCVPLVGENRFFVKQALRSLNSRAVSFPKRGPGNIGLAALIATGRGTFQTLDSYELGWRVCPRINAVGRMELDTNMAVELLTTNDHERAAAIAKAMSDINRKRQELTRELCEKAIDMAAKLTTPFIVLHMPECPIGVAGLVAGRVTEATQLPTLIVNDEGRGSGRAPEGLHLMSLMSQLKDAGVFGKERQLADGSVVTPDYGGHAAACGFHHADPQALVMAARKVRFPTEGLGTLKIEAETTIDRLTLELGAEMDAMEPFGIGNPYPNVLVRNLEVVDSIPSKDNVHLRLELSDGQRNLQAVWLGAAKEQDNLPSRVDVVGVPSAFAGAPSLRIGSLRPAR